MIEINLCIPTLNRYDLLYKCLVSAEKGSVAPTHFYVIDNGGRLDFEFPRTSIIRFGKNIGVAKAWNWFALNVPEIRIICNDDILFKHDSIEQLIRYPDSFSTPGNIGKLNYFSCFILPNGLINSVGLFDENISPDYAYFEDYDYNRRMELWNIGINRVMDCYVEHAISSTKQNFSKEEYRLNEYKFELAKSNYLRKWGGLPPAEK